MLLCISRKSLKVSKQNFIWIHVHDNWLLTFMPSFPLPIISSLQVTFIVLLIRNIWKEALTTPRLANQQNYCTTISINNLKEILHKLHNIVAQWVTCLKETELQEIKFIYSSPRSPCAEISHFSNFLDRFLKGIQKAKHGSKAETATVQYKKTAVCLLPPPAAAKAGSYHQCCGSGSGIRDRVLFDPWIRDPGSGIRKRFFPDPGSRIPRPYF